MPTRNRLSTNQSYLSRYKIMWLFLFFDIPVKTKPQAKEANLFRKELLKNGFIRVQYSVYSKVVTSKEEITLVSNRIKLSLPIKGHIEILQITDRQYEDIICFKNTKKEVLKNPSQLVLF